MSYGLKVLSSFLLGICAFNVNANCQSQFFCPSAYVAGDVQLRDSDVKGGIKDAYKNNKLQPHALVGLKLNDCVGFELGGYVTKGGNHKFRGVHGDVVGFIPVVNHLDLGLSIGATHLSTYFKGPVEGVERKPVLRVGSFLQYAVDDHFGVRGGAVWENTSNVTFKNLELKDHLHYSLGLVYNF